MFRAAEGVTVERTYPRVPEVSVSVYGGGQSQYAYQGHNVRGHNAMYDSMTLNGTLLRSSSIMEVGEDGSRSSHEPLRMEWESLF